MQQKKKLSVTSHTPLLLLFLVLLVSSSSQPSRQRDGAEHALGRLDSDIALTRLRRRAILLLLVLTVVGFAAMFRAAAVMALPVVVAAMAVLAASRGTDGADAVLWDNGLGVEWDLVLFFFVVVRSAVAGDAAAAAVVALVLALMFAFRAVAVLAAGWGTDRADAVFGEDSPGVEWDGIFILLVVVVRFAVP